jgi:hypothetical protein
MLNFINRHHTNKYFITNFIIYSFMVIVMSMVYFITMVLVMDITNFITMH